MPPRILLSLSTTLFLVLSAGCQQPEEPLPLTTMEKDYDRPLPPGEFALRKITDPSMYPDFRAAWYRAKRPGLRESVQQSIAYLHAPSSQRYFPVGPITHERVLHSLNLFLEVLDQAATPEDLEQLMHEHFDVYISVGCDDAGTVLFTGYYSPIFDGSLTQTEQYRFPIYKLPPDVKKDQDGNVIGGPWRTREEISRNRLLDGHELAWLGDRFETYVITVQGSGFIRLADGNMYEVGYAGNNGHEYTPIGRMLVADGKINRHRLSLDTMIKFFKQYPQEMDEYLFQNKRYVFFQESKGGPYGCLGKPVTPEYSIATDKEIFPRASLAFLSTRIPDHSGRQMQRFRGFVLDQDTGGAIRAPGRCDFYMGVGDTAGVRAGHTYNEGKLYYIFAKEGATLDDTITGTFDDDRRFVRPTDANRR